MMYQRFKDQSGEPSLLPCLLHVILTGKILHIIVADKTINPHANTVFFLNLPFRYLYTYKIGYTPKMEIQKIFKPLKNVVQFILTPMNGTTWMIIPYSFLS